MNLHSTSKRSACRVPAENRRAYFAYGLNLRGDVLQDRCPRASFVCTAKLKDHQFIITSRGTASVIPRPGSVVHGAVATLARSDEFALDQFEGVHLGFYRKRYMPVLGACGRTVQALVYVSSVAGEGRPRRGYLEAAIEGAIERELDTAYIRELGQWLRT